VPRPPGDKDHSVSQSLISGKNHSVGSSRSIFFLLRQLDDFPRASGELETLRAGVDEVRHLLIACPPGNFARPDIHEVLEVIALVVIDGGVGNAAALFRLAGDVADVAVEPDHAVIHRLNGILAELHR